MLQKAWFSNKKWVWLLAPLSVLFWLLSSLRRLLFRLGIKHAAQSKLPVIIVGNISIGGNGKTPLTIALVNQLITLGYVPAVLSRGYGGSQNNFPHRVTKLSKALVVGDEPALMAKRLNCDVVIDPNRVRGCQYIEENTRANVIICDDGLQHYALKRDIELCVFDGRGIGNGFLLPMGPLREGAWRLKSVDMCIINTGFANIASPMVKGLSSSLQQSQKMVPMRLASQAWVNVKTGESIALNAMLAVEHKVKAIAGIGDPQRFFDTLTELQVKFDESKGFADHYAFTQQDLPTDARILMTEKDAVKCSDFAHADCWYLEISAQLPETFYAAITEKIIATGKLKQAK